MWWTKQTSQKYLTQSIPSPLLDKYGLYKDNFATGIGDLSKVIADIMTAAKESCFFVVC